MRHPRTRSAVHALCSSLILPAFSMSLIAASAWAADTAPPAVAITQPVSGATVASSGFVFGGTASDVSGIKEVRIYVYDYGRSRYTVSNALASYSSTTGTWSFSVFSTHITPGKSARLWVRAIDTIGNASLWQYVDVQVSSYDIVPPSLTITQPAAGSTIPPSGVIFQGTATDNAGVVRVNIYVYDYGRSGYTVSNALATYSSATRLWSFPVTSAHITPGSQARLMARATDTSYNISPWQTLYVQVQGTDTTPPTTPSITDSGATTTSTTELSYSFTTNDPESGVIYCERHFRQDSASGPIIDTRNGSCGTANGFTDGNLSLQVGKTYYIGARAQNGAGLWSNWGYADGIQVISSDTTPPTTPVVTDDGTYTASASSLHATWSSADPESRIVEYQYLITQSSTAGTVILNWTSSGTTPSVTQSGLSLLSGTTYYFSVKAKNGAGLWSAVGYSDGIKVDTTAPSVPGQPTEGSPDVDVINTGSYTVYWAAAADPESGIGSYELQERIGTTGAWSTLSSAIAGTSYAVSGRVNGTTYYYQVHAKNGAGLWGAFSSVSDGIRIDTQAPTVSAIGVTNITASSAALNWTTSESAICSVRCGTTPSPTTQCATTSMGTSHATTLSSLAGSTTYYVGVTCSDAAGNTSAASTTSFTTSAAPVPTQPSIVTISGRQLLLQKRLPNGTLAPASPYIIRGVGWSPTSTTTSGGAPSIRRPEFGRWYQTDLPLMKVMNVNTVRLFIDPGVTTDTNLTVPGLTILDECYRNGIMVIMTVDEGGNNVSRIQPVVQYYRNHPAILLWSVGSEWNINRYFNKFASADDAAVATEQAAQLVKQSDTLHPVVSSYGTLVNKPNNWETYVKTTCPTVDVWSFNEYRGTAFSRLFDQWALVSGKPMFVGEFGIDAYNSTTQAEDQATHASWVKGLWDDLARNLSANSAGNVALGGTVFEWNDEWWKAGTYWAQDTSIQWTPEGFPDKAVSEDWWGIVTIDRTPRQLYNALTPAFGSAYVPPAATRTITYRAVSEYPVYVKFWENGSQMYIGAGASIDGGRGFNIASINLTTGQLRDGAQRFDTWGSRSLGTAGLDMINYLNGVPNGTLLLIAVGDEAGLNNFDSCTFQNLSWVTQVKSTLQALGSTKIGSYCYRDQWAMIAVKGQGVALSETLGAVSADAPTQTTVQLP